MAMKKLETCCRVGVRTERVHHDLADTRDRLVALKLIVAKALVARAHGRLEVDHHVVLSIGE